MISSVTALRVRLFVANLRESELKRCTNVLMKQLLYTNREESHFFSFTRTSEEISLILDEDTVLEFPENALVVVRNTWRALSVSFGSVGYTGTGIVSGLCSLLARAGISVFYLSTANTDFVLVSETKLEQAIAAIRGNFNITMETDLAPADPSEQEAIFARMKQNFRPVSPIEVIFKPETATDLTCTLLPEKVHLCSLSRDNRPRCAYGILKLVFFSESDSFFSISETEDEISMLIADDKLEEFPEDSLSVSDLWRPIQRFKKTSYTEIGVVAALSAPISRGNIPILYMSTFLSAFVMVQVKNVPVAVLCLESQRFKVQERGALGGVNIPPTATATGSLTVPSAGQMANSPDSPRQLFGDESDYENGRGRSDSFSAQVDFVAPKHSTDSIGDSGRSLSSDL